MFISIDQLTPPVFRMTFFTKSIIKYTIHNFLKFFFAKNLKTYVAFKRTLDEADTVWLRQFDMGVSSFEILKNNFFKILQSISLLYYSIRICNLNSTTDISPANCL